MKTKTFLLTFPLAVEEMDKQVNDFLKKNKVTWEESEIVYNCLETYMLIHITYEKST